MAAAHNQTSASRFTPVSVRNAAYSMLNESMGHSDSTGDAAYGIGAGIDIAVSLSSLNNSLATCRWWQSYLGIGDEDQRDSILPHNNTDTRMSDSDDVVNSLRRKLNELVSSIEPVLKRVKAVNNHDDDDDDQYHNEFEILNFNDDENNNYNVANEAIENNDHSENVDSHNNNVDDSETKVCFFLKKPQQIIFNLFFFCFVLFLF